ncbi:MAG: hypothetical protein LBQ81_11875 [Zoogloeaceae bacterium]|jgi:hypothetical protein|nr:hypothetical protein [Zoogloeaceae bacterium]
MPKNFFLALALSLVTQVCAAEPLNFYDQYVPPIITFMARYNLVFQGELEDDGNVVMELKFSRKKAGEYSGRYFSARDGLDIPLEGTLAALVETGPVRDEKGKPRDGASEPARYIWKLTREVVREGGEVHDEWVGQRTDQRTGEARAFRLRRVTVEDIVRPLEIGADEKNPPELYAYLQIHAIAKPVGTETGNEKLAYQMWEDPRTGFQYPRLTRHPDPEVMQKINFLLAERHGRFAALALWAQNGDCHAANARQGFNRGGATVIYLTSTLMSMVEAGALHLCLPEFYPYQHPVTFDLARGTYLDWNRLFDLFVPGEDKNGPRPRPGPAVRKLVENLEQERQASGEDGRDCTLSKEAFWDAYFADPGELVLERPYRGAFSCMPQASIPFSRLTPILKPEGRRYLDDRENVADP